MFRKQGRSLKRNVGILGNFAFGYADVAGGIYFTLGIVALSAGPATAYAYLFATIAYVLTALSYAELASTYQEAGGAFIYAKHAFGRNVAFLAAWALLLDYVVTTSIFSLSAVGYVGYFLPVLHGQLLFGLASAFLIVCLIVLNVLGILESARFSYVMVLFNLVGLSVILVVGYLYSFHFGVNHIDFGTHPTTPSFLFAVTIAMSSYLGIEVISQSAGETRRPSKNIPRAVFLISAAVVSIALAFSTLAMGIIPYTAFAQNPYSIFDPIAFVAQRLPFGWFFATLAAIVGTILLVVATNSGIVGVSRIAYAMSQEKALPGIFGSLHRKYRTPFISIVIFSAVSIALAFSGQLELVAQLYNFGALLAYMVVGLSLISLRNKDRNLVRPFTSPGSLKVNLSGRSYEIPLIGLFTFVADLIIWLLVVTLHPLGREVGAAWMGVGLLIFLLYTRTRRDEAASLRKLPAS